MSSSHFNHDEHRGLPPDMLLELQAELADHAASESETYYGQHESAVAAASSLPAPSSFTVTRDMAAAHALDQLGAQVLALPRGLELLWLGGAGAGVLLALGADLLAVRDLAIGGWLVQSLAVFLTVAGVAALLQRSWSRGPGVALARGMQLTFLLACGQAGALRIAAELQGHHHRAVPALWEGMPLWFTAPAISWAAAAVAIPLLLWLRLRALPLALGVLCAAGVMYYGGPWPARMTVWRSAGPAQVEVPAEFAQDPLNRLTVDETGHLLMSQGFALPGRGHRLGREAIDLVELIKPPVPGQQHAALPGELHFEGRVLLQPVPDSRLSAYVLCVGLLLATLTSLAALCVMLRCYPHRDGTLALVLHCAWTAVVFAPYAQALISISGKFLHPTDFAPLWWRHYARFANDPQTALLCALLLVAGSLGSLVCLGLALRRRPRYSPRLNDGQRA